MFELSVMRFTIHATDANNGETLAEAIQLNEVTDTWHVYSTYNNHTIERVVIGQSIAMAVVSSFATLNYLAWCGSLTPTRFIECGTMGGK